MRYEYIMKRNDIKQCINDASLYLTHIHPTSNIELSHYNTFHNTFNIIDHFMITITSILLLVLILFLNKRGINVTLIMIEKLQ